MSVKIKNKCVYVDRDTYIRIYTYIYRLHSLTISYAVNIFENLRQRFQLVFLNTNFSFETLNYTFMNTVDKNAGIMGDCGYY